MCKSEINEYLWQVKYYLMKHYGVDQAVLEAYPLRWYVYTGRASAEFLRKMLAVKPFVIARILHKGFSSGSDDETLGKIKARVESVVLNNSNT